MYNGVGIDNVQFRTEQIGDDPQDTISMVGWFVCNGFASTPNLFQRFIRGDVVSGTMAGSDDAIVVQHNHVASSENQSASHSHSIGNQSIDHIHGAGSQSFSHSHVITSDGAHVHSMKGNPDLETTGTSGFRAILIGALRADIIASAGAHTHPIGDESASHSHVIGVQSASHSHTAQNQSANHNHAITVNNEGASGITKNRPMYFNAIYITRLS